MVDIEYNTKDEEEKVEETIEAEEAEEKVEETIEAEEEVEETIEEEETTSEEETSDEKDKFDYREYGKETVEETRNMAEKMFNDVVATLKSKQSDWNKTLEEYKANKPSVDLLDYEDSLVIKVDVPRATKDDISIQLSSDAVEIEIDFPNDINDDEDVTILRKERCVGKTKNVIALPAEIELKEVAAKFDKNVLTITLPKVHAKKVDVEIL